MYNKQLDTFVKAVECGSFSKAAEELYVTPSAVIQQIKSLENRVGVRLLDRTSRGVSVTEAGKYFYEKSKELIARSEAILAQMKDLQRERDNVIRVVANTFHPIQILYELWFRFHPLEPNYELVTETIYEDHDKRIRHADLVEGVYFHEAWQKDFSFLQLTSTPVHMGFFSGHPMATRSSISYQDMKGLTVVTIRQGLEDTMDRIYDDLNMRGIRVIPVDVYDNAAVTMCATRNYAILMPLCWKNRFENLTLVPCEWDHALPYGFFVSQRAAIPAKRFAEFMREQVQAKET